jgi:hypothetical protein
MNRIIIYSLFVLTSLFSVMLFISIYYNYILYNLYSNIRYTLCLIDGAIEYNRIISINIVGFIITSGLVLLGATTYKSGLVLGFIFNNYNISILSYILGISTILLIIIIMSINSYYSIIIYYSVINNRIYMYNSLVTTISGNKIILIILSLVLVIIVTIYRLIIVIYTLALLIISSVIILVSVIILSNYNISNSINTCIYGLILYIYISIDIYLNLYIFILIVLVLLVLVRINSIKISIVTIYSIKNIIVISLYSILPTNVFTYSPSETTNVFSLCIRSNIHYNMKIIYIVYNIHSLRIIISLILYNELRHIIKKISINISKILIKMSGPHNKLVYK